MTLQEFKLWFARWEVEVAELSLEYTKLKIKEKNFGKVFL